MKLNLSKFKLKHHDGKTATLVHPSGHEMRVALHAIDPSSRKQLMAIKPERIKEENELKMAEGGEAQGPCQNPNCKSAGQAHPNCRCYGGYAEGGSVSRKGCKCCMADGGQAEDMSAYDMDPQSAAAMPGMAKLGKAAYESKPVQNIITGEPLRQHYNTALAAGQGDSAAQAELARESLNTAMGTVKSEYPDAAESASPLVQQASKMSNLNKAEQAAQAGTMSAEDLAKAQQAHSRAMDMADRLKQQTAARKAQAYKPHKANGGEINSGAASQSMPYYADGGEAKGPDLGSLLKLAPLLLADGGQANAQQQPLEIEQMPPSDQQKPDPMEQQKAALAPPQLPAPQPGSQDPIIPPQEAAKAAMPTPQDNQKMAMKAVSQDAAVSALSPGPALDPNDIKGNSAFGAIKTQEAGEFKQAQDMIAAGMSTQGLQKAAAAKTNADQQQTVLNDYNAARQELRDHILSVSQAVQDQHIDPLKVWHDKDSSQKVMTGIGLVLGGLGAGMSGGQNQAMNFFQKQIDNSIEAQKIDLNNKHSVLAQNLDLYKSMPEALAATRLHMNNILGIQLQMAADKAMSPLAKANALQAKSAWDAQNAAAISNFAANKALFGNGAGQQAAESQDKQNGYVGSDQPMGSLMGAPTEAETQRQLQQLRIAQPEMYKDLASRYVPGVGVAHSPVDTKDREAMANMNLGLQKARSLREWSQKNSGNLNPAKIQEGQALAADMLNYYRTATDQGTYKPSSAAFDEKLVDQNPTKFFNQFRTDPKYKVLENSLKSQLDTKRGQYGIQPSAESVQHFSPQEQRMLALARSNPSHPNAKAIFKKLGVSQ